MRSALGMEINALTTYSTTRQKEVYATLTKFISFLEMSLTKNKLTFGMDEDECVLSESPLINDSEILVPAPVIKFTHNVFTCCCALRFFRRNKIHKNSCQS